MGRHKTTPAKGRPTEVITLYLPQSVVNTMEILAKRHGWKAVEMVEDAMTRWIAALTHAEIRDTRFTKAAGVPFPPRNGDLLHGKAKTVEASEPIFRYSMKLHEDTLEKLGDIAYWRGVWRADVMREAMAHFINVHDPDGTWADWYFERRDMIVPSAVQIVTGQSEAFHGKSLARGSIIFDHVGGHQDRPNGDRNP